MIGALVLDFDGTVLDTEGPEFQAWSEIYASFGCALTVEEWAGCLGTQGGFDPYAVLVSRSPVPVPPKGALNDQRRRRATELLASLRPRPGVLDWLEAAAAMGLGVGLASSSSQKWVEDHLAELGLRSLFGCLVCCDESVPAKPDPTSYRLACQSLGVDPSRAIAVEDSPHGVAAAVDAGLFCVAVPHRLSQGLDLGRAHVVVPSLADLSLVEAIALARPPGSWARNASYSPQNRPKNE